MALTTTNYTAFGGSAKLHPLADQGKYFVATNPTPGTGIASGAVTSLADTTPYLVIKNNNTVASGIKMYLDFWRLTLTAAGGGGTVRNMTFKLDSSQSVTRYTSGGSVYLYFGADLLPAIATRTTPELMAAVAGIYSEVQYTDFPARAKVLAREIARAAPTLIGLQEAPMWLSGPLLDPAPATHVEYDFIEILRTELAAIGAPYDVVRAQPESNIEAPAGAPYLKDIRLLDRECASCEIDGPAG